MENILKNKKWWFYFTRWQFSGIVLAPCIYIASLFNIPIWLGVIIANFIGSIVFWYFDTFFIFTEEGKQKKQNKCNCSGKNI